MLAGQVALIISAVFAGAALYVNIVEQPARLFLDDRSLLREWKLSYKRGYAMQAPLAIVGFLLGLLAWWQTGLWTLLAGAIIMMANWPYTLLVIMPTNNRLMEMDAAVADTDARRLIEKWAQQHAVRTGLGFAAVLSFLWGL